MAVTRIPDSQKTLSLSEIIKDLQEEATTDQLTGLLNKAGAISAFTEACQKRDGYFSTGTFTTITR